LVEQFQVYSDPSRDPSAHNECCFFGWSEPKAGDDAKLGMFESWRVPTDLCFDHDRILRIIGIIDYGLASIVLAFYCLLLN